MLNSQDLQQLKIDALLQTPSINTHVNFYADLFPIFNPASSDHVFIRNNSNSNILSFTYVLLAHIFDNRLSKDIVSNSSEPQTERLANGDGSKNTQKIEGSSPSSKAKQNQQHSEPYLKLYKLYSFIYNEKINLSQICNIPQKLQRFLSEICQPSESKQFNKNIINLYLKNIIIQFLKFIPKYNKSQPQSQTGSLNKQNLKQSQISYLSLAKQFCIANAFQKYSICEIIITILFRSILYFQYEINQALDYSQPISDHTVYTALCDAFQYNSLKLQQNYTQISYGSYIRVIRLKQIKDNSNPKKNRNIYNYYLVSLPLCKTQNFAIRQLQDIDSFRIRRSSIDNLNNQSVSFRQNSKQLLQKKSNTNSPINNSKNYNNKLEIVQENKKDNNEHEKNGKNQKDCSEQKRTTNGNNVKKGQFISTEATILSKNQKQSLKMEKPQNATKTIVFSHQNKLHPNSAAIQNKVKLLNSIQTGLCEYTNIQIVKQLSPQIRESMIKNIWHYRNVVL